MDAVETIEYKNYTINVYQDVSSVNPIKDFDQLGKMVCWHRDYILGHDHDFADPDDFNEFLEEAERDGERFVILPLYLYDHSGISISTGSFSCPWDSGQVGYIYVSYSDIRKEYSRKRVTKKLLKKMESFLRQEVALYDNYLTGQVYGYIVTAPWNENEEVDSCWGYFGDLENSGLMESARGAIDCEVAEIELF